MVGSYLVRFESDVRMHGSYCIMKQMTLCVSVGNTYEEVHTPLDTKLKPFSGSVFCFLCSTMIMPRILPHALFHEDPLGFRNRDQYLFTLAAFQHHPTGQILITYSVL